MSEDRICTITIDKHGKAMSVDLEGFHGQGCSAVTEALEAMGTKTHEQEKPEFYESCNQNRLRNVG